jgi:phage gpG-like protein
VSASFKLLDPSKVAAQLKKNITAFIPAIQKGMKQGAMQWIGKETKAQMSGRPGLMRQTGTLARSWFVNTVGWGHTFAVKVATNTKYAKIHQTGGVIKPTSGRYLAIPLNNVAKTRKPRDFDDAFFIASKRGNRLIVRRSGKGLQTLYLLKESVKIPKRLYIYERWQSTAWEYMNPRIYANIMKDATIMQRKFS